MDVTFSTEVPWLLFVFQSLYTSHLLFLRLLVWLRRQLRAVSLIFVSKGGDFILSFKKSLNLKIARQERHLTDNPKIEEVPVKLRKENL
ncbi:hypothetical protein GCM10007096_25050 [Pullulanibacillus pueri]|uniref:Uncharacterized protein n=1 Tax=Pullulanibacillus pueri TaxID=1437324 RepID=A0A8J3EMP8_9BACL|nr:hypothetical protein GCM10007096_25050 [Pullulanibacillus pueri]